MKCEAKNAKNATLATVEMGWAVELRLALEPIAFKTRREVAFSRRSHVMDFRTN
jgi:hypothetical protein